MARAKGVPALELYRLAQKKKRKLVLCGHSLGGAVSPIGCFVNIFQLFCFVSNVNVVCSMFALRL